MSQGCSIDIMSQASEKFSLPSSSDEDDLLIVKRRKKKSKFKSSPGPTNKESDSEDENEQLNNKTSSGGKKKIRRIQMGDSSSEEDDIKVSNNTDLSVNGDSALQNSIVLTKPDGEDGISNKTSTDLTTDSGILKLGGKSSCSESESNGEKLEKSESSENDSDSEKSSDDDAPPLRLFRNKNAAVVNESRGLNLQVDDQSDDEENDDGPDPSEIAEPRRSKPRAARRPTMVELHSETQRLVRESSVNLPYHRPEPKKLSEFMKRPTLGRIEEKLCEKTGEEISANIDELPDIGTNILSKNAAEITSPVKNDASDTQNCENKSELENTQPVVQARPLTRRERLLQQIGSKLPQLNPKKPEKSPGKFVDLDEESSKPKQTAGVDSLMQRFMRHSKAGRRNLTEKKKQVELNIIRKQERADGSGIELVSDSVTVASENEVRNELNVVKNVETVGTPGQKLQLLRQQLAEKMKRRREIERKKREELHKLDNEEIDQSDAEDEEEEDCDWSEGDTDEEAEKDDETEKQATEVKRRGNGVIDSSDESDSENTEPLDGLSRASGTISNDTSLPRMVNEGSVLLFEDSTRSSASTLNKSGRMTPMLDRTCSDDSFYGSMIPLHQPEVSNISNSSNFIKPQVSKNEFDDTCFESDSRSLSQPFRLEFEASQSQFLDADGFIKESSISKPAVKRDRSLMPPGGEDDNAMADCNMSQLLGLCSAPFDSPDTQKKPEISRLMNSGNESAVNSTQDLIGLCTGNFTDSIAPLGVEDDSVTENDDGANKESTKIDCDLTNNDDNSGDLFKTINIDESFGFNILSGQLRKSQRDPATKFSEEEKSDEDDDQPMTIVRKKKFTRKRIAREFVENEAELSGSDVGSEDEDDDAGPDEYEVDEPVEELPEEEEIARQVNRVHRRQLLEEDQRDIEFLQEALLGGEEIAQRERKFRWKNIDSTMTQDMFKSDDEDSNHGDRTIHDGPEDSQWMKERLEREEFLQKNESQGAGSEDSQLLNLGRRVVLSRQNSIATSSTDKAPEASNQQTTRMRNGRLSIDESSSSRDSCRNKGKRGSFLSRSQDVLAKLASLQGLKNVNGPRHSDKMLFKAVSPKSKKQTKRKQLSEINNSTVKEPPKKRSKVININEDSNSVFDLM